MMREAIQMFKPPKTENASFKSYVGVVNYLMKFC